MYYLFFIAVSFSRCGLSIRMMVVLFVLIPELLSELCLPTLTQYTSTKAQRYKHVFVLLLSDDFIRQKHDIWGKVWRIKPCIVQEQLQTNDMSWMSFLKDF